MITADEFKAVFRLHPAGVALITAAVGEEKVAITASSVSAVSADPPLVMFSVSVLSTSAPVLKGADTLVIHLLGAGNLDLALLGADKQVDRFGDTAQWELLPTGEPVFPGAERWMRARVLHRVDAGGSTVFVVEGIDAHTKGDTDHEGLVYFDRSWHRIGEHSLTDVPQLEQVTTR